MVAWDREGDKRDFECATASILHVVVCKNHSSGKVEELGTARLSLSDWLKATDATPVTATSGNQGKAVIKVKLFITAHTAVSPETDDGASAMDQAVQTAKAGAQAMSSIPGLSIVGGAGDRANALETSAMNTINVWQPLLDNLDWFVKAMDVVSEVLPPALVRPNYSHISARCTRMPKWLGLCSRPHTRCSTPSNSGISSFSDW
ncbi:hypothetical protein CALCODRAFT_500188 [Calocera cornea HHB12733]|uniref:Uncharacterized protein n=1 Tax=Calocera cornea HHB12733 TaxID=1353952 RepID=A0A165E5Y4_9BASI|nr:hypothetical protein CALCODRAFT_500188 [Calocera cornea HHB12733]